MFNHWIRHRLCLSIAFAILLVLAIGFAFIRPYIYERAAEYNAQSLYRNTMIDFIIPEPSFEQVVQLPGSHGIQQIFSFFTTRTPVTVNGTSRTTMLLLADSFDAIDITMYNDARLIRRSEVPFDNPIFIDWQFANDTSARIGDIVFFTIGGVSTEYRVAAIYETNSVYDSGAIIVEINDAQISSILANGNVNGFSGAFVLASEHSQARNYFTTQYRPLGRLRERERFDSDEAFDIHYRAIMDNNFASEITDFRMRENTSPTSVRGSLLWGGVALGVLAILAFNLLMFRRGCEVKYFKIECLKKGVLVGRYYTIAFIAESLLCLLGIALFFVFTIMTATQFIPTHISTPPLIILLISAVASCTVSYLINNVRLRWNAL